MVRRNSFCCLCEVSIHNEDDWDVEKYIEYVDDMQDDVDKKEEEGRKRRVKLRRRIMTNLLAIKHSLLPSVGFLLNMVA
jgi:hypothetical protein